MEQESEDCRANLQVNNTNQAQVEGLGTDIARGTGMSMDQDSSQDVRGPAEHTAATHSGGDSIPLSGNGTGCVPEVRTEHQVTPTQRVGQNTPKNHQ